MTSTRVHRTHPYLAGFWGLVYLLGDLPIAATAMILGSIVLVAIACVPAFGVGLVVLMLALPTCRWFVELQRLRTEAMLGVTLPPAVPVAQPGHGARGFPGSAREWFAGLASGRSWIAAAYVGVFALWGTLASLVMLVWIAYAVVLIVIPLFGQSEFRLFGIFDGIEATWAWSMGGVAALLFAPFVGLALRAVDVALVKWACGDPSHEAIARLESRVESLTSSRGRVVDSVEAERRRIERDLHDGPQQRLVALAMDLGMAREALDTDPERARELIERAHAGSKEAVVEMRQVARGIAPPVLTDRGLDAALSALAARSAVPVSLDVQLAGRPGPAVEAIAYFCVSEALTNVAKHSGATQAQVRIRQLASEGQRGQGLPGQGQLGQGQLGLQIEVSDDGSGGADPDAGTGLKGLAARVAAVDGTLAVTSPPGGPTVVGVLLPWNESEVRP